MTAKSDYEQLRDDVLAELSQSRRNGWPITEERIKALFAASPLAQQVATPHRWEPDFSEGEPALDSKICGVCGKEHEESATNVRESE